MKKFLLALGAVVAMTGMTACNGSSSKGDTTLADSLNITFGEFLGQNIKNQMPQIKAQFPDADEAKLLRGLEAAAKLDTADISYAIGYSMGLNIIIQAYQWNQNEIKTNPEKIVRYAIKSMSDTAMDIQKAYMNYQTVNSKVQDRIQERAQAAQKAEAEANEKKGEEYVASLKKEDNSIQTTESGLSYRISNPGDATRATDDSSVKVIYTGRHTNGEEFDSSKGQPVEFSVSGVVSGFSEGLKLLGKGGRATLYIPGKLGYGESGQPMAGIGPNEMLVFDIEVVDIIPGDAD
ncbi:MAG: FKBP-type peptidyl-prolyl cis-trans isomerase [Muribaculaceae bacterium]|nr:FKBP-type peptidyl-prolyl cis-trans isomerase [Muribaculaceae bacterium]